MKVFNLVRERQDGLLTERWTDTFLVDENVTDPEAALRAAVKDFLGTAEGKKAVEETFYDFNWGDVMTYIPDKFFEKHGLRLIKHPVITVCVNQDEILCK